MVDIGFLLISKCSPPPPLPPLSRFYKYTIPLHSYTIPAKGAIGSNHPPQRKKAPSKSP